MHRSPLRAASLVIALALAAAPSSVLAAPALGGVAASPPSTPVPPGAADAFATGAEEAEGGLATPRAPPAPSAERIKELEGAHAAIEQARAQYLKLHLRQADRLLSKALDRFLSDPTTLERAEPAMRAASLLAQIRIGRRKRRDADEVLARALQGLPGFPGSTPPPPEVIDRLVVVRKRLAGELSGLLWVNTEPSGAEVRVNGALFGASPVTVRDLVPGRVRVHVTPAEGPPRTVDVEVVPGRNELKLILGAEGARRTLLSSIGSSSANFGWRAAARLQAALDADSTCVAVLTDSGRVIVARLDASSERVLGATEAPAPAQPSGWRALGRYCSPSAQGGLPPEAVTEVLWPPARVVTSTAEGGGSARGAWGWGAVAVGAAAAGAGVFFGLQALAAEDDFKNADSRNDAAVFSDRAKSQALFSDISFGVGAALIVTGVYLLLTSDG